MEPWLKCLPMSEGVRASRQQKIASDYHLVDFPKGGRRCEFLTARAFRYAAILEGTVEVKRWTSRPVALPYCRSDGKQSKYIPDFLVETVGGKRLIDIEKAVAKQVAEADPARAAVAQYCSRYGVRHEQIDPDLIGPRMMFSANWFRITRYLLIPVSDLFERQTDEIERHLISRGSMTLLSICGASPALEQAQVLQSVFYLMHIGKVHADLSAKPLDMHLEISL